MRDRTGKKGRGTTRERGEVEHGGGWVGRGGRGTARTGNNGRGTTRE